MRIRLLNLLLLTAVVLAVSRLWLFLREPAPALPAITAGAPPPAGPATKRENKVEVAESRPEAYDVIIARDLFSPTRGIVPPAPTAATKPAPKPQPPPKLTLYGVVILDGQKSAYLQEGTQEGRPRKVRENENFANGVVKTIRPDGVSFLFDGSEINVPLRTPKDVAGAAVPSRQAGPGSAPPQPQAPVAFPRRQVPPGVPQGQVPSPGRPGSAQPGMPMVVPPAESEGEVIIDEEFPEESMPVGDIPGMTEEEVLE